MAKGDKRNKGGNIIIKREEVVEGGHHGGAWKVAYADFVTAMMAFFLLMWLINATTEEQRKGLADYFSPTSVLSHTFSGSGQPFGGHTAFDQGQMASDRGAVQVMQGKIPVPTDPDEDESAENPAQNRTYQRETTPQNPDADAQGTSLRPALKPTPDARPAGPTDESGAPSSAAPRPPSPPGTAQGTGGVERGEMSPSQMTQGQTAQGQTAAEAAQAAQAARQAAAQAAAEERRQFAAAAEQIKEAVRQDPALAELGRQLAIDITPEGLRIQIMDEIKLPMFATGSAAPNDRARMLLQRVVPVLNRLTEDISISGYTDAAPYPGPDRTNWELSTERANATRHLLTEDGLADSRIKSVTGHADRDPLLPEQPLAAANRRIAIMVLRRALPPRRAPTPAATMPSAPSPAPAPAPASAPAAAPAPAAATPATPAATAAKPPPPAMSAPPAASGPLPAPPAFVAPPASAGPAPATAR